MRLLVVSDTPFLPPTAGNRERINRMLGHLRDRGIEVGMLMLPAADRSEWDVPGMRSRLDCFEIARPPASARVGRAVMRLTRRRRRPEDAPGVDDWCPRWFRARSRSLAREWSADAVLAEYVYLSACLEKLPCLKVLDTHDVMHRRRAVYDAAGLAPQWFHTTAAEERRGLLRADLVLAIEEEEARLFRELVPGKAVLTVPHGVPPDPAPLAEAVPGRLLFVASYNDVNVRGLHWFLEAAWPGLRAAVPGVELHVCGSIASKLGALPAGVSARGILPSLRAEYAESRAVIDPVPWGTGLPIKVIEALAHGRPVVSVRGGLEGAGEGLMVAEGPAGFAAAIRLLLADDALWRQAAAGAASVAQRYSPEAAFGPLFAALSLRVTRRETS